MRALESTSRLIASTAAGYVWIGRNERKGNESDNIRKEGRDKQSLEGFFHFWYRKETGALIQLMALICSNKKAADRKNRIKPFHILSAFSSFQVEPKKHMAV